MIHHFRQFNCNVPCFHVVSVDDVTGQFSMFNYNIINQNNSEYLLKFGEYETNTSKMGYKQPKDYFKRAKELKYEKFNITELDQYTLWNSKFRERVTV